MDSLKNDHTAAIKAMSNGDIRVSETKGLPSARRLGAFGRVVVTVDVEELHCPIELEVGAIVVANVNVFAPGV